MPGERVDISIVAPVYNEEATLPLFYRRLKQVLAEMALRYEIIFVDDGSSDGSAAIIRRLSREEPGVRFLLLSRNFGHQPAVMAGLDHCRGACAVIIDSDLQDPPEVIPELYRRYRQGFEVVNTRRARRRGENLFKRATARLFYTLLAKITDFDIPLDAGDFKLIDRAIIDHLRRMPERHKYLRGQIAWLGFRQTTLEYERQPRHAGSSGYPLRKMIRLAWDGITAFSDFPLKVATWSGFAVSLLAFAIILYALYSKFILHETITGWTSLIVSSMFIGGIQLMGIGIIGEYIGRINSDVRQRPVYIIQESNDKRSQQL